MALLGLAWLLLLTFLLPSKDPGPLKFITGPMEAWHFAMWGVPTFPAQLPKRRLSVEVLKVVNFMSSFCPCVFLIFSIVNIVMPNKFLHNMVQWMQFHFCWHLQLCEITVAMRIPCARWTTGFKVMPRPYRPPSINGCLTWRCCTAWPLGDVWNETTGELVGKKHTFWKVAGWFSGWSWINMNSHHVSVEWLFLMCEVVGTSSWGVMWYVLCAWGGGVNTYSCFQAVYLQISFS